MNYSAMKVNAGSDVSDTMIWGGDAPVDLTSYTVEPYDVHPDLEPHLELSITDAGSGEIGIEIPWSETFPVGRKFYYRVRLVAPSGHRSTTQRVYLEIV